MSSLALSILCWSPRLLLSVRPHRPIPTTQPRPGMIKCCCSVSRTQWIVVSYHFPLSTFHKDYLFNVVDAPPGPSQPPNLGLSVRSVRSFGRFAARPARSLGPLFGGPDLSRPPHTRSGPLLWFGSVREPGLSRPPPQGLALSVSVGRELRAVGLLLRRLCRLLQAYAASSRWSRSQARPCHPTRACVCRACVCVVKDKEGI
ncbi:hypothetical protein BJY00DRAFT_289013 [Aspergillus carlsbadensis]|nr:hypothetical protein BJY00DRAFT_289013 [Aspergillus carlsbadensis]